MLINKTSPKFNLYFLVFLSVLLMSCASTDTGINSSIYNTKLGFSPMWVKTADINIDSAFEIKEGRIQFSYLLKKADFSYYPSFTADIPVFRKRGNRERSDEYISEKITFQKADIGVVKKGKWYKRLEIEKRQGYKVAIAAATTVTFPSHRYKGYRVVKKGATENDYHRHVGYFSKGQLVEGFIFKNETGHAIYGEFDENGYQKGEIIVSALDGRVVIATVKNGTKSGGLVLIDHNGNAKYQHYGSTGENITKSYIETATAEKVNTIEKKEAKVLLGSLDKEIKSIENQRNNVLGGNSTFSRLTNRYSGINSNKCHCVFNICLTREKHCGYHDGTTATTKKISACELKQIAEKENAKRRENALENVCRSLRSAGLLLSSGDSLEDAIRNTVFDNKKMSPSLRAELKRAQAEIKAADNLKSLAMTKSKMRQKKEESLRQQQRVNRKQREKKVRQEVEIQIEKYKLEKIKRAKQWKSCIVNDYGLDPKNIKNWRVYPQC